MNEYVRDGTANMIKILCKQRQGLNICHINAQSLTRKIDELRYIFENSGVDVVCVSETWFNSNIDDRMISMDGYNVVRVDRRGHGGGVALYIKRGISFNVISLSNDNDLIEYIFIGIKSGDRKLLLGTVYRPNNRICIENFLAIIEQHSVMYNDVIIAGDFNSNLLVESHFSDKLIPLCLYPVNTTIPTHFSATCNTLLDLFLVGDKSQVLLYDQLTVPCFSKHDLIFLTYDFNAPVADQFVTWRDFKNIDISMIEQEFLKINWENMHYMLSVDEQATFLENNITYLYNVTVPLKTRLITHKRRPWFSVKIKMSIMQRNIAFARWKRFKIYEFYECFKKLRRATNKLIKSAKRAYYAQKFATAIGSKEKWTTIREIGIGKGGHQAPCDVNANDLNNQFLNLPSVNANPTFCEISEINFSDNFSFECVNQSDVFSACLSIKSNAVGIDDIHPKFIKIILPLLLPFLTHFVNKIITTSCFPSSWKKAKIIPIPKNNSEYRPIAILPFLSKAFERILYNQISDYLEKNSLLTDRQSGFRRQQSCITALVDVAEDARQELDKNNLTFLVLLDHSKAFDTVDHSILCEKLRSKFSFSRTAIQLTKSYLSNRYQYVQIVNSKSSLLPVRRGVPQGSIMGPLLFNMYANDLPDCVNSCKVRLYADDVQVYISCDPEHVNECVETLNGDLGRIHDWASANGLSINPSKSKCLIISKRTLIPTQVPQIDLNGQSINIVKTAKNLGIVFNSNLTWSDHINSICGRTFSMLRNLWQIQHITPIKIRSLIAKTYLMPVLMYGCELFASCDALSKRKLNATFNNIIRYVYELRKYDHVSSFSHRLYGNSLEDLMKTRVLSFLHKIINTQQPWHLFNRITFARSRRGKKINSFNYNSLISTWQFFIYSVRLWNMLPNNTQTISNAQHFKKKIQHLL